MCSFWNYRLAPVFVPFSILIFLNVYTYIIIYLKTLLNKNALRGKSCFKSVPSLPHPHCCTLPTTLQDPEAPLRGLKRTEPSGKSLLISEYYPRGRRQDKCSGPHSSPGGGGGESLEIHAFSQSHRVEWATVDVLPSSSLEQPPTTLRGSKISARIWNYQTVTRKNSCYFKHRESKLTSKEDAELRNYRRYHPRGRVNLGTLL